MPEFDFSVFDEPVVKLQIARTVLHDRIVDDYLPVDLKRWLPKEVTFSDLAFVISNGAIQIKNDNAIPLRDDMLKIANAEQRDCLEGLMACENDPLQNLREANVDKRKANRLVESLLSSVSNSLEFIDKDSSGETNGIVYGKKPVVLPRELQWAIFLRRYAGLAGSKNDSGDKSALLGQTFVWLIREPFDDPNELGNRWLRLAVALAVKSQCCGMTVTEHESRLIGERRKLIAHQAAQNIANDQFHGEIQKLKRFLNQEIGYSNSAIDPIAVIDYLIAWIDDARTKLLDLQELAKRFLPKRELKQLTFKRKKPIREVFRPRLLELKEQIETALKNHA